MNKAVDHNVPRKEYFIPGDTFIPEIFQTTAFAHKQEVRQNISYNPVDLFGHGTVKATQTRFNVGNFDTHL